MPEGTIPLQVTRPTIDEIVKALERSYSVRGWSRQLLANDRALLRRIGVHPDDATMADLEKIILRSKTPGGRANYAARIRSLWRHMRRLGLIESTLDDQLPHIRKPRSTPTPLTDAQVDRLLRFADQPYRDWFTLGCYAGLRAMEVSGLEGADLYESGDSWRLRVRGKGGTDLVVPVGRQVADVIRSRGTLGRLWKIGPNKVSARACAEMRRLGIERRFHDCRHWYATTLLDATDGDLPTVAELMRHGSILTTRGYAALNPERPIAAVKALEARVVA
jgi:integrase